MDKDNASPTPPTTPATPRVLIVQQEQAAMHETPPDQLLLQQDPPDQLLQQVQLQQQHGQLQQVLHVRQQAQLQQLESRSTSLRESLRDDMVGEVGGFVKLALEVPQFCTQTDCERFSTNVVTIFQSISRQTKGKSLLYQMCPYLPLAALRISLGFSYKRNSLYQAIMVKLQHATGTSERIMQRMTKLAGHYLGDNRVEKLEVFMNTVSQLTQNKEIVCDIMGPPDRTVPVIRKICNDFQELNLETQATKTDARHVLAKVLIKLGLQEPSSTPPPTSSILATVDSSTPPPTSSMPATVDSTQKPRQAPQKSPHARERNQRHMPPRP